MRIDAHQHYWQLARGDYDWLTPRLVPIYRDFGPGDLAPHLDAFDIARTVLVQAAPTEAETDFMLDLAGATPSVAGVIGWVDLGTPEAAQRIARLGTRPKLVGLRPMIHDIADPRWMLSVELEPAYAAIEATGLTFDALVRPVHLRPLEILVERHPGMTVVVDHGAKPDIARWAPGDEDFSDWVERMHQIGRHANVLCKVSGLATEARSDWASADLTPYLDTLLDAFGPERLMFGSDWPVVNLAGGYERWMDALLRWLDSLDCPSRDMILGATAAHVYKLTER